MQCIGAALLDAGLLFGLHVLIFMNPNVPVQLWPFPTTIAGDFFVSLIVTSALTWIIGGAMVWGDVIVGSAGPLKLAPLTLDAVTRLAARGGWIGWMATVSSVFDAEGWSRAGVRTSLDIRVNDTVTLTKKLPTRWFHAAGANGARGVVFGMMLFFIVWPIAVGICAGLYGNDGYNNYPQAPAIFAVYGAFIGAIITPVVATLSLATAGRAAAAYSAALDAPGAGASAGAGVVGGGGEGSAVVVSQSPLNVI